MHSNCNCIYLEKNPTNCNGISLTLVNHRQINLRLLIVFTQVLDIIDVSDIFIKLVEIWKYHKTNTHPAYIL